MCFLEFFLGQFLVVKLLHLRNHFSLLICLNQLTTRKKISCFYYGLLGFHFLALGTVGLLEWKQNGIKGILVLGCFREGVIILRHTFIPMIDDLGFAVFFFIARRFCFYARFHARSRGFATLDVPFRMGL